MAHEIPPRDGARLAPVQARRAPLACLALLTTACAIASFALACATPFAAFAVIAAATLARRAALLVVAGAWLVNQGIGFGALHYPVDATTLAWGAVIGLAAAAATAAASILGPHLARLAAPLALALTLALAYAAYEFVLVAATPVLGGATAFTASIVIRLGLLNLAWLVGLVSASEAIRMLASRVRPQRPAATSA